MAEYSPFENDTRKEARAEDQKREQTDRLADLLFVMEDPSGRRFMHRLLSLSGLYRSSFVADPNETAFNEGMRNIGLNIMAEIMEIAPSQYAQMLEEQRHASS